jgi:hypothetical protein
MTAFLIGLGIGFVLGVPATFFAKWGLKKFQERFGGSSLGPQ